MRLDIHRSRRAESIHPQIRQPMSLVSNPSDAADGEAFASTSAGEAERSQPKRSGPLLAGIRVLDLTNVLSGPFCAYQLAQLGAEVIKIEMPRTGDLARQLGADEALNGSLMGASFLAQNAGKKSITLDLKTSEGREILLRLAKTAHVLVENFRPAVMERLGLGYEALSAANRQLIYCAISGFGQDGPLKDAPAYDQIIQGLSGMMSITGDARSAPLRVGYPIADTVGGITAAFAICAALLRQGRTGEGAFLDVSMLDSALATMGWVVSNYLIAGQPPVPKGNENFTAAPSGTFKTGAGLINIAANKQQQFEALARILGRDDLITDPRFAERESRKRHRDELKQEIELALAARPANAWEGALNAIGIPAGRVLDIPEALQAPQVRHRDLVQQIDNVPGAGKTISVTRLGFKVSGCDGTVSAPPPQLGQHTDEIMRTLGYAESDVARLRRSGVI
jgi:crotonobetainyl-CoA:carnitine CoA-transferase CaiB-like acyl-CoA transferase